jgi:hypothetical protein
MHFLEHIKDIEFVMLHTVGTRVEALFVTYVRSQQK